VSAPAPAPAEPAIKSYFFDKGYRDLRDTIAESWRRNLKSASEHFAKVSRYLPGDGGHKLLAAIWGTAGVSVVIFGTVVFVAASVVHVAVLAAFFLIIYLGFSVTFLAERGFLAWKGFFPVCPDCHSRNPLAWYFCGRCGAVHRRLIPSSYGILHHTCRCGERLPATFFLRRSQLRSCCPACMHPLTAGHSESRKTFVPVFGGPGVGKSAFLTGAADQLLERLGERGLGAACLDARTTEELDRARRQLAVGQPLAKTVNRVPRAFNILVQAAGEDPRVLYLYDPAGDLLLGTEDLAEHRYSQQMSGLIFLIDPFAIPAVRDRHAAADGWEALKPSELPVEDALSRLLIGLEEHFGLSKETPLKVPVAVVVNKIDACGLDQLLGERAVQARLRASSPPPALQAARNEVIRQQLRSWGQGDVVQQLETRCARLGYFACSALGRVPDDSGQPFAAHGVLDPLWWILGEVDRAFVADRSQAA
jgi:hypothetical protein